MPYEQVKVFEKVLVVAIQRILFQGYFMLRIVEVDFVILHKVYLHDDVADVTHVRIHRVEGI